MTERLCMAEVEWRVTDLLDPKEPFVNDVELAKQVIDTVSAIKNTETEVRIPKAAIEFAQNTLSEWFEIIAEIEKKRGNMPYLIDRSLYSAKQDGGEVEWNQGLRLEDFQKWIDDEDMMERFGESFPRVDINDAASSEEPLSGYYNRILPMKLSLRVLAAMAFAESHASDVEICDGISLNDLRGDALKIATYAREWLSSLDAKVGSTKGSEISVGFPDKSEKAAERFVAQFVGSKRKKELSGALIEMGLINCPKFMGFTMDEVRFTNPGWEFAMMRNPIIDGGFEEWKEYGESGRRFSDDEIKYLLAHFKQNVPAEWKLLSTIANLIDSGSNRPKTLEDRLIDSYEWDKTKASQMRNGALSRMEELCLIVREKKGREVTYSLTDLCRDTVLLVRA
ncbi:hypothetical protein OAV27_01155 [Euryarchaeota archaeon]|nr:hypothetical protein [Euryarchaeota archaeon]